MKDFKKRALIIGVIIFIFIAFATWYKHTYSMGIAKSFEVNNKYQPKNLLIATQSSQFKDTLVGTIVERYKQDSAYIKVIDIGELSSIDPINYNAILVIHTWEYSKPPASVRLFIERTTKYHYKIVVFATSGAGSYALNDIDAIAGESKIEDIPVFTENIFAKLNPLIK